MSVLGDDRFVGGAGRQFDGNVRVMVLCALAVASAGCPVGGSRPCVDATQMADDDVSIKLINETSSPVHLIGSNETNDPCNRVDGFGDSRFIWVRGDRIGYTIRAISNGILLDEITCTLPEEPNVRYGDTGLRCTAG